MGDAESVLAGRILDDETIPIGRKQPAPKAHQPTPETGAEVNLIAAAVTDSLATLSALPDDRREELDRAKTCAVFAAYGAARAHHREEAVRLAELGRCRSYTDALVTWETTTANTTPELKKRLRDARNRVLELEQQLRSEGTDPVDSVLGRLFDHLGPGADQVVGSRVLTHESEGRAEAAAARARLAPLLHDARRKYRKAARVVWSAAESTPGTISADEVVAVSRAVGYPLIYLVPSMHETMALIVDPHGPVRTVEFGDLSSSATSRMLHGDDTGLAGFLRGAFYDDPDALASSVDDVVPILNAYPLDQLDDLVQQLGYGAAALIALGSLALLPLHARATADGVVFRMAPSARVLRIAHESRTEQPPTSPRVYVLAAPDAEGRNRLSWAPVEAMAVRHQFKRAGADVALAVEDEPTNVLEELEAVTTAHFACHATFRPSDPLGSTLHVNPDAVIELGDIAGGRRDLRGLELVVLSACQTAATETRQPDDALGFPSQLLVAGASGVVSTAWPADDAAATFFSHRFYQELDSGHDPAAATQRARAWLRQAAGTELRSVLLGLMDIVPLDDTDAQAVLATARVDLLQAGESRPFEHPVYWAAFEYVGV